MYFAMLLFWTTIVLATVVSLLTKPIPEYRVSEAYFALHAVTDILICVCSFSFVQICSLQAVLSSYAIEQACFIKIQVQAATH
jgi:hypothetical protein